MDGLMKKSKIKRKLDRKALREGDDVASIETDDDASSSKPDTKGDEFDREEIHAKALKRYARGYAKDETNKEKAYQDLKFLADEDQWTVEALAIRTDEQRPCLILNKCPQFVRQVTGDIRQMRPAVKVTPVDSAADEKVAAKTMPGLIRYVENRSDAKAIYYSTADQQVGGGIGHFKVITEYSSARTFDQEMRIAPIEDGIAVVWDADAILPTREDGTHCFVPFERAKDTAEEEYPDGDFTEFDSNAEAQLRDWMTADSVKLMEYYYKEPCKVTLALYQSGEIVDLTDDEDGAKMDDAKADGARIEERDSHCVYRCIMSAREILDGPELVPGPNIPIVPMLGEEIKIGKVIVRRGITRALIDVQRSYNYLYSQQTEVLALQPKAPFIGTKKQFEQHRDQWENANRTNAPYIEYTPDPLANGPPQRQAPPQGSTAIAEMMQITTADMSGVTGIYPSSLGQSGNESSGKAIMARQREGDTGTFVYVDNFARAIRRCGQIIVDMAPHVYDTARTLRIIGEDGKIDVLKINQKIIDPNGDGIATKVLDDVTAGAYDVSVEMGPSFSTKRQEAAEGMATFMQAAGPEVAGLFIDLFAKMQDWPLHDKIAKRAQMMLPPNIQAMEAAESGEPPPQAPQQPPSPQDQLAHKDLEIKNKELDVKSKEIDFKAAELNVKSEQAQMGHAQAQMKNEQAGLAHVAAMNPPPAPAPAAPAAAPADDATTPMVSALVDKVDELDQSVEEIAQVLAQLMAAVNGSVGGGGGGPPAPPDPGGLQVEPMPAPSPADTPPPPGGFFMPGEAAPLPPV